MCVAIYVSIDASIPVETEGEERAAERLQYLLVGAHEHPHLSLKV